MYESVKMVCNVLFERVLSYSVEYIQTEINILLE